MTSSSKGKAKCSRPPFYGYLDNLREEFDLLTDEFIRMKKQKDELEATIESQIEELERMRQFVLHLQMRHGHCCQHCNTAPVMPSVAFAARTLPFPHNSPQFQSLEKPDSLVGIVSQKMGMTPLRLDYIPSQSISGPISFPSLSTFTSRLPSPSLTPSPSPDSGPEECDLSITFNHEVEKELDVEMVNVFVHGKAIECVKFSHDGKYLAAGCQDGKVYVYNVATGALVICFLRNPLREEDDCIRAVCFSPDGQYLAAGALNGYIYIWDINPKYLRKAFKQPMGLACTLDFSQSGRRLVSASEDNTVRLWSMRYGALRVLTDDTHIHLGGSYSSALFSPDERYVAASHHDGMVRIWSARTGQLMRRVRAHMRWANDIAFMPDGTGLMSGGDKTLKYLDVSSLQISGVETLPEREFSGHEGHVFSVDISPDGRWVASGSCDRSVRIWDIHTSAVQCILNGVCEVWAIEFSPAGGYLASSGFGGVVRLWRYSYITR